MASIPLPALSAQAPQQPDPLTQYGKLIQLRNMANEGQVQQQNLESGAIELQQRKQQLTDQQAMTAAMQEWDGKDYDSLIPLVVKHGASANAVMGLKTNALGIKQKYSDIAKNDAETGKNTLDSLFKRNDLVAGQINSILAAPDEELPSKITQTAQDLQQKGLLDPQHAQIAQSLAQMPADKARQSLKLMVKDFQANSQQMQQAKDDADLAAKNAALPGVAAKSVGDQAAVVAQTLGSTRSQAEYTAKRNFLSAKGIDVSQTPEAFSPEAIAQIREMGISPEKAASLPAEQQHVLNYLKANNLPDTPSNRLSAENDYIQRTKVQPQITINQNKQEQANAGTTGDVATVAKRFGMTPESMDAASEKYFQTGVLPPIGRGNPQSIALNKAIMNRATELHPGESLAESSAAFKANSESLKKLQTQRDAVVAFENTAGKNLDLFLNQAQKVVDSGSPWINKPLRSIAQQGLGSSDLAAYNAARQVAINEIAKVTSNPGMSGQLSDSARHEVQAFNPETATLKQTLAVAKVLKQDMENRRISYDDQIADIRGRMKVGGGQQQKSSGSSIKIKLPSGKEIEIQ